MRRLWIMVFTGGMVTLCSGVASAATIRVPDDQPTIQLGIDAAVNGDTVLVGPGTYVEHIDYTGKTVAVIADGPAVSTIIEPLDPSLSTIVISAGEGAGTVLQGFTIRNGGTAHTMVTGSFALPTISDCIFTNNIPLGTENKEVISCNSAVVVRRNLFYGNGGISCVGLRSGGDATQIINNTMTNNARGIFSVAGGGTAINNIIASSESPETEDYGIYGDFSTLGYNDVWGNDPDYSGGATPGPGSISADPRFANPSANDYTLNPASPCVDAGNPDPLYNDPDGTRSDMGAFPLRNLPYPVAYPIDLGSESADNVVNHHPTFHWTYVDTSGLTQTGFECEVGIDAEWSAAEMWSSGPVASSEPSVVYGGAALIDGESYFLRIRVGNGVKWGGWISAWFHMNQLPTVPELSHPVGGATIPVGQVLLSVHPSSDPDENDLVQYDFQVFEDAGLTVLVNGDYDVSDTVFDAITDLTAGATYWWRARTGDGHEHSDWSAAETFVTRLPAVLHVPSEYATIQLGIDAAADGDTVRVAPGTYAENIDYSGTTVAVIAAGPVDSTIIEPLNPDTSTIVIASGEGQGTLLKGITIRNGGPAFTVMIDGFAFPTISHCVFHNNVPLNTRNREVISCRSAALIRRNLFFANGGISCIGLRPGGGGTQIVNNTMSGNSRGIFSIAGGGTAINNIIASSKSLESDDYGIYGDFSTLDYNCLWLNNPNYDGGASPGQRSIQADPRFVNPSANDYTLQSTSPCIDAGDSDPSHNDPDGSRNDMGAFPFVCNDPDGDGFGEPGQFENSCPPDNCPGLSNPDQADSDGDGIGDACDQCYCRRQGDLAPVNSNGDGVVDVLDVIAAIDHVFRSLPQLPTDQPLCPRPRADIEPRTPTCGDGIIDVLDVVGLIGHVFRGSGPICNPCLD